MLAACAAPRQTFMHRGHRQNFALQPKELESVQFYISTDVLARNQAAPDSPDGVVVIPVGTQGALVEAGDDWLRVSFSPDGDGAFFVIAPTGGGDSAYWLATHTDDGTKLTRVKDLDPKVVRTRGGDFRLIYGDGARLMINSKQLQELIDKRTHLQGREPGK
jgi:hypothetical protein